MALVYYSIDKIKLSKKSIPFFEEGALEHIHLFVSRDKVFEKESVLQETIIIKAKKTQSKPNTITITTTQSNADFSNRTVFEAPYSTVVNGDALYVCMPTPNLNTTSLQCWHHFHSKPAQWNQSRRLTPIVQGVQPKEFLNQRLDRG